jgi:hypothetical protein
MTQLNEQQKYQLAEVLAPEITSALMPEPLKTSFYEKEKVETTILMAGTTKLTENFVNTVKKHFVFKGSEKWAEAKIYGSVRIFTPDIIFDFSTQKFSIEKKVVGDREFFRIWFSPSELEITTTSLADIVKKWCEFRHLNIDCNVTQEILKSCD